MPRGGARPGSGRKPKLVKYELPVNAAERQIIDNLPNIVGAQIKLALGQIIVQDINPVTGEEGVYALPPDRKAGEFLMNRIMGRPTERVELDADVTVGVIAAELSPEERARVRAALIAGPPPAR